MAIYLKRVKRGSESPCRDKDGKLCFFNTNPFCKARMPEYPQYRKYDCNGVAWSEPKVYIQIEKPEEKQ